MGSFTSFPGLWFVDAQFWFTPSVGPVSFTLLGDNSLVVGTYLFFWIHDLNMRWTGSGQHLSLCRCWGGCPDRHLHDILTYPRAYLHSCRKVSAHRRTSVLSPTSDYERWYARMVHILQRLTVFAVNTGTWTATFALLSIILVRVRSSPPACLQRFLIKILVDACPFLSGEIVLSLVHHSALFSLLQHPSCQLECQSLHWGPSWNDGLFHEFEYGGVQQHQTEQTVWGCGFGLSSPRGGFFIEASTVVTNLSCIITVDIGECRVSLSDGSWEVTITSWFNLFSWSCICLFLIGTVFLVVCTYIICTSDPDGWRSVLHGTSRARTATKPC